MAPTGFPTRCEHAFCPIVALTHRLRCSLHPAPCLLFCGAGVVVLFTACLYCAVWPCTPCCRGAVARCYFAYASTAFVPAVDAFYLLFTLYLDVPYYTAKATCRVLVCARTGRVLCLVTLPFPAPCFAPCCSVCVIPHFLRRLAFGDGGRCFVFAFVHLHPPNPPGMRCCGISAPLALPACSGGRLRWNCGISAFGMFFFFFAISFVITGSLPASHGLPRATLESFFGGLIPAYVRLGWFALLLLSKSEAPFHAAALRAKRCGGILFVQPALLPTMLSAAGLLLPAKLFALAG